MDLPPPLAHVSEKLQINLLTLPLTVTRGRKSREVRALWERWPDAVAGPVMGQTLQVPADCLCGVLRPLAEEAEQTRGRSSFGCIGLRWQKL